MDFCRAGTGWCGVELGFPLSDFSFEEDVEIVSPGGEAADPSEVLEESEEKEGFGEGFAAVSESAGQESASMTGPTSIDPSEGRFQAGFFAAPAPSSTQDAISAVSGGAISFVDGSAGEDTAASGSPRTTWDHGEEGWREGREGEEDEDEGSGEDAIGVFEV